jgi:hypothetical protein
VTIEANLSTSLQEEVIGPNPDDGWNAYAAILDKIRKRL